jgi:hypothetical protein
VRWSKLKQRLEVKFADSVHAATIIAFMLSLFFGSQRAAFAENDALPPDCSIYLSYKLTLIKWVEPDTYSADQFAAWVREFWGRFDRDNNGVTLDEIEYVIIDEPMAKDRVNFENYHRKNAHRLLSEYSQIFHIDPTQDGVVTLGEIADMARAVFAFADEDGNGGFSTAESHRLHRHAMMTRYRHCTQTGCTWK